MGSTLFVILTGMEIGLLAAAETGTDSQAVQSALFRWFIPILLMGAITFALEALRFPMGSARSRVLSPQLTRLVVGALVIMAIARFVPRSAAPYVIGAAAI